MAQDVPEQVSNNPAQSEPTLGLPSLLNILFRGKRTIVFITMLGVLAGVAYGVFTDPLFRAKAQVRPGIVSYSPEGAPVREWALKDIVRWFRTGLYWDDLRTEAPYDQFDGPPVILAEFISSGPQYLRGGDVITLTNLATDPLLAADILRKSILAFNTQSVQEGASGTLQLTLGGAQVIMDKVRAAMDKIDGDIQRVDLEIGEFETLIAGLGAENERLTGERDYMRSGRKWRLSAVEKSLAEAAAARLRLAEAEKMLAEVVQNGLRESDSAVDSDDPVGQVLLQTVRRNEAALAGELVNTTNKLGAYIYQCTVRADSLLDGVAALDKEIAATILSRDVDLVQQQKSIELKIQDLVIKREVDLPSEKALLAADLLAQQVRIDMLSPLEQVGSITVSQNPVRPRKLRALTILTALAFMGSIFVVFAWEYFRRNRDAIFVGDGGR